MEIEKDLLKKHFEDNLPKGAIETMNLYVQNGSPMGDFLTAVFENNLFKAIEKADECNIKLLNRYVTYIYNFLPFTCYGSPEKVGAWIKRKGLEGKDTNL